MRRVICYLAVVITIGIGVSGCSTSRSGEKLTSKPPTAPSCPFGGDCNDSAIIYGGFASKPEFDQVWDANTDRAGHTDLRQIYQHFSITRSDFDASTTVPGLVYADGRVKVGNRVVATNVLVVGRTNYTGTSVPIAGIIGGPMVYETPPSTDFLSNSIPAWVSLSVTTFNYAILKSGGEPVIVSPKQ